MTKGMNSEYEALGRAGQGMSEKEWAGSSWRERGLGVGDSDPVSQQTSSAVFGAAAGSRLVLSPAQYSAV